LSKLETVADQFGLKRLYPGSQLFNNTDTGTHAVQPSAEAPVSAGLAPIGSCEFVGELVAAGCEGRYCSDGTFCSPKVFADAKVFVGCPTRKDKLKTKQGT
jgi:hypothetical protein